MNGIPWKFCDEVIHRLSKSDIEHLTLTSGYWSSTADTHFSRRRELLAKLLSNKEGTKVGVKLRFRGNKVPFEIDFKYDRIESIEFGNPPDESVKETLEQFRTKTLPMIRSIASGCSLKVFVDSSHPHNLCDIIFDGLKECTGLSDIDLSNYGEKCQQFIRRQIEFGSLKSLCLSEDIPWHSSRLEGTPEGEEVTGHCS